MQPLESALTDASLSAHYSPSAEADHQRLLAILERLMLINTGELRVALSQIAQILAESLNADKVDALVYDTASESLVALGVSATLLGKREAAIGMNRHPLANGGRAVRVFQSDTPYLTGAAEKDPEELSGIVHGLGVRSTLIIPTRFGARLRGVMLVCATRPDAFTKGDLDLLCELRRWIGAVIQRVEETQRLTRQASQRGHGHAIERFEPLLELLAHDLRNYFTPLKARIDLIRLRATRQGRTPDAEDADEASRAAARLNKVIDALLDVARLDQGLATLSYQPVDLSAYLPSVAVRARADNRPVEAALLPVTLTSFDPDRIQECLEHLIGSLAKRLTSDSQERIVLGGSVAGDGGALQTTLTVRIDAPVAESDAQVEARMPFALDDTASALGVYDPLSSDQPQKRARQMSLPIYLASRIATAHKGDLLTHEDKSGRPIYTLLLPHASRSQRAGAPQH